MYKIDKNTWDVMQSTKNKVIAEDFSIVVEHDGDDLFDESKHPDQATQDNKQDAKNSTEEERKTEIHIQKIMQNLKRDTVFENNVREVQEKEEAKKVENEAYEKGYSDCAKEMEDAINSKLDELVVKQNESIAKIEKDLIEYKEKVDSEILENTLGLSLEIAEKIVRAKLTKHDDLFVKIVKNAIAQMDSDEEINVKLNHKDYQKYFVSEVEYIREEMGMRSLNFSSSPDIEEGGCIVETDKTFVDAGVNTQLKSISDAITKETEGYDETLQLETI